jgi:capsule synthesis protein PGA_cap
MNSKSLLLWESARDLPVVARVAIAGDFLPAGNLAFASGCGWREMARVLDFHLDGVATTFLNLECVLGVQGLMARRLDGIGQIVSAPADSIDYLEEIRCNAIGLANNHCYDFGSAGLERTRRAISARGMLPLGAGRSLEDTPEIFVWQGPGSVRVGFWAAAKATLDPATRRRLGVEPSTLDRAKQALAAMRNQGADFCIALLHAGCIRTNRPDPEDVRWMDLLAKSGFNLLAACHSHRIAGFRQIGYSLEQPSFCFYGLGSLVSGYISSPPEREGLIIVASFGHHAQLVRLEARPVLLDETGFGTVPGAESSHAILARFERLSGEIADGSFERLFYRDMSKGMLQFYLRDARAALRESGLRGLARKAGRMRARHVRRLVRKMIG